MDNSQPNITIVNNNTNNNGGGGESSQGGADPTKTWRGIVIPVIIAGVFSLAGIFFTYHLSSESKESTCPIRSELVGTVSTIEAKLSRGGVSENDFLVLSAYLERFKYVLKIDDLCEQTSIIAELKQEIIRANQIVSN